MPVGIFILIILVTLFAIGTTIWFIKGGDFEAGIITILALIIVWLVLLIGYEIINIDPLIKWLSQPVGKG